MFDEAVMCNLCVRSLPRGIDNLDDENLGESDISQPAPGTSTGGQMTDMDGMPDPAPPSSSSAIPLCKCDMCQIMPQEIEKFCAHRRRVTTHTEFSQLCFDFDVLQLAIRNS